MSFVNAKEARPVDDPKALVPFGWAPGGYHCAACSTCGEAHAGSDKRSMRCQDCAEALRDKRANEPAPTTRETAPDSLNDLFARAVEHVKTMTPEEREAMHERQKKAWVAAEMAIGDEGTRVVTGYRETADHAELARLAEAATPGPWYRGHNENGCAQGEMSVWPDEKMIGAIIAQCGHQAPWAGWFEQPAKDAAFIAAANPATVLSLLSEIAALRGERDGLKNRVSCLERLGGEQSTRVMEQATRAKDAERQRDEARDTIASTVAKADWMQGHLSGERSSIDRETIELVVSECRAYCHLQALANQGADQCRE